MFGSEYIKGKLVLFFFILSYPPSTKQDTKRVIMFYISLPNTNLSVFYFILSHLSPLPLSLIF